MNSFRWRYTACLTLLFLFQTGGGAVFGQFDFDREPIRYSSRQPTDRIHALNEQLRSDSVTLEWDARHGWLPALLQALDVPRSSQTLVFSKTSLQFRHIDPSRPRALYFSDDVYVGWVRGGNAIELTAVDRENGAIFYTMDQTHSDRPRIGRDRGECMSCHVNRRTKGVPGFVVRSVYTQANGQPDFTLGSVTSDHTTEFRDRFGGWYVTGKHGRMRHRGNVVVTSSGDDPIDREIGSNRLRLPSRVASDEYLEPGSDLVALMVLEHQTQMHNLVTRASYTTRQAVYHEESMNRVFDRPAGYRGETTVRRIRKAAEGLVEYLFFCDEYPLSARVEGSSAFTVDFARSAVKDGRGRSLRDFDLERRLFRYPCSYLVYAESFLALPEPVRARVRERMLEVLTGEDESRAYSHLFEEDRGAILEILSETHPWFRAVKRTDR